MKTNTLPAILIVTAAGIFQFALARDNSPRERSSGESVPRSMSGSRNTVPFQTASGAGAPSFSSQTEPTVRTTRSPEPARATGGNSPSFIRSVPYVSPSVQQQTTSASTSSREASRVPTRAAVHFARQPDVTASYPSRNASHVYTRSAVKAERQPDVATPSHDRDNGRMSIRTSAPTVTQPDVTASYPSRDASRVSTRAAVKAERQLDVAMPSQDRDNNRMSKQAEAADGSRAEHSRRTDVAQPRSTSIRITAPVTHDAMDGRSAFYRTSVSSRTPTTSSDVRRDLRPDSLTTPRPSEAARPEAADRLASRTATSDRNRFSSTLNIHSPNRVEHSVQRPRAIVNHSIVPPALRDSHLTHPSSFTQRPPPHVYYHDTYRSWRYPTIYPIGWGMVTWSSPSFFSSFSATYYTPGFTYTDYSYGPCNNRWYDRYYSTSYAFYGGWRHGWYGGFSYVFNPWPVYSTYYFCDPPTVLARTETVYVTQPAAAAVPITDAASSAPAVSNATATVTAQDIAADRAPTDLWSEYDTASDDFTLDFASYAETMDAERIWSSYSELDGSDPYENMNLYAETAAITSP